MVRLCLIISIYLIFIAYVLFLFETQISMKIKKLLKEHKIIIIIFSLILISLFILPIIIKQIFSTNLGITWLQIVDKDNYQAWIGYYGAILGGALTLLGVWWTIKDNEKKKSTELDNQYFPVPLFTLSSDDFKPEKEKIKSMNTIDKISFGLENQISLYNYLYIPMYIYNLNSVEVFNLFLKKATMDVYINDKDYHPYDLILPNGDKELTSIILKDCKINCELFLRINNHEIIDNIIDNNLKYNINLYFEYKNKLQFLHSQTAIIHCDTLTSTEEKNIYQINKTRYVINVENVK